MYALACLFYFFFKIPSLCLKAKWDISSSLLFNSNRWKGDPPGFSNAVSDKLRGKYRKKRNMLHHLEAAKTVEDNKIAGSQTKITGKNNHRTTTFQHKEWQMKK